MLPLLIFSFFKLCKSKAHHTSLTSSFTCHSYLGCIPKPLHTLTHSQKFQLQRTTKSPLRWVKALENPEPGSFHKLGLELLPHSNKHNTFAQRKRMRPLLILSLNTAQIKCTSLFLNFLHLQPRPSTFNQHFQTYLLRNIHLLCFALLGLAWLSFAFLCFRFPPVRAEDLLKSVVQHYRTRLPTFLLWNLKLPGRRME